MKGRISATIDEEMQTKITDLIKKGRWRNKSHFIEEAIKFFIKNHDKQ